jgi:hypothetical protein
LLIMLSVTPKPIKFCFDVCIQPWNSIRMENTKSEVLEMTFNTKVVV